MSVLSNCRLIPFIFFPGNVTRMMIPNQDLPFLTRLVMARTFARVTVHDLYSCFSFAERINPRIDGVGQYLANISVNWEFPNHGTVAHGESGQRDFLVSKPDHHLTYASKFVHLAKDQMDCLLHALIGILNEFAV